MDFEWDERKEANNRRKHDIGFIEASEAFGDEHSSCVPDPDHSEGEARYLLFGMTTNGRHLVVSFTERAEAIRLISARDMTRKERKACEG